MEVDLFGSKFSRVCDGGKGYVSNDWLLAIFIGQKRTEIRLTFCTKTTWGYFGGTLIMPEKLAKLINGVKL